MATQERENDSLRPRLLRSTSKAADGRNALLSFGELPEWHQDNQYILRGYRPISGSARASFRSWSYIHNESVNIYSHLIPAVAFLLAVWYIKEYLTSRYSNITGPDFFIFTFFLLTAVICLGLSATYHTLMNHSHKVEQLWLRLDLIGIVALTLGDFVSGIYMVFWCEPLHRKIYWSMIGILGSLTIFIMVTPKFQGQNFRILRALTFVFTGLSGFAPLIHGVKIFGISQMMKQSGMPYYLVEGGFLLLGALIYATRFPESRYPGKFDIYGSSHQLFHILVVFAAVTQLIGILDAFGYNHANRTCV
ncbi:mPR-like GPCR protein [Aspergillus steynii IBT 23096]|uniref:MPR-like GPCR protein n=1 Tax=Aspergillus steynii IBT 23096 TaxID=1392250 RepID=A0A2I2GAR3_9EURO|nr:mPR-like GPCR protein [Aspergillus steynii IBT 23096]PLB49962.1 mPR-like GPCR protein [Aspergillus steynii IBT 23096]